jgi:carboxyl-terminal processing protease
MKFALLFFCLFLTLAGVATAEESTVGVGLQVVPTERGDLVVLGVVEGSPAQTAGVLSGDLLVQVDDLPLAGIDFETVARRYLWGKAGTEVTLKYMRPGVAGVHSVTLRRQGLQAPAKEPVGVRMLRPGP